jgi:hypothetical protein
MMVAYNKDTPILLVVLGKIKNFIQIYKELQRIESRRLYLFFDAPINENGKTSQEQIRMLFNGIAWDCKVKYFYSKKHLKKNASMLKAADWFFGQETEGIVLDGLSVPLPSFFAFCSCMLEKYRNDERIGHISG